MDSFSSFFFSSVGTYNNNNPRKRGREGSTPTTPIVNSFISMQTQAQNPIPRQLIDLTQLHINPHPNAVSTGLQLAFQDQQQQQQQLRLSNHHQQHILSSQSSSLLSQDFRAQINQHAHDEIQQFLQNQVPILPFNLRFRSLILCKNINRGS